jgi:hypothetical protein
MFYKFLNRRINNKISKLHPIAMKYLGDDLENNDDKAIVERLKVIKRHAVLRKYFETDQKRLYMVNKNYLNFLKAIMFLYRTSRASVSAGTFIAPTKVYHTIIAVQDSFRETVESLSLK